MYTIQLPLECQGFHRSGIIHNVNDIVYQHFNQPGHSILSMQNIAGLAVFGSTFRNEPMLFSVTKIQNIM
jgi:hypothetical protein